MNRSGWRTHGIAALLAGVAIPCAAGVPPTLGPEALRPGQRAVVLTVFSGAVVDSFEAEIVGTLEGGRTEGTMIVGRATSERVVRSGIAQGMSGSPVFVGGRLIGALSSAWSFGREPLFGITPIGEMLALWERPEGAAAGGESAGPTGVEGDGALRMPRFRELRWADDDAEDVAPPDDASPATAEADPEPSRAARLALPLACGGLAPEAMDLARRWLEPFGLAAVPAGRARPKASALPALEPGSAVAIEVLRGDLRLSAIGTLTWRDGDRLLMFGHPLFQSGDVFMPLARADIVTIVASQQLSFKLGGPGEEVGAVFQDRRTGVSGRLGARAGMLPVAVEVTGPAKRPRSFRFESVYDRALAPSLVGIAAVNSLLESGGIGSAQTFRWTLRVYRRGAPTLELGDVTGGDSPVQELAVGVVAPLRFLFGNPFASPALDSVLLTLEAMPGRRSVALRGARVLEPTVRAGDSVHVTCEIERWRGPRETRVVSLAVPAELPDGRYTVWVGGGSELSRYEAARLPDRYRATSLDDGWRRLAATRPSDALYGALFARAPEVTTDGRDYPELPASALALLGVDAVGTDRGRRGDLARLDERRLPLQRPLRGELVLSVVVDSSRRLAQP